MSKPTYEQLEQERNGLAAQVERLRLVILNAIPFIPGGNVKANLRDAYDETPPASLASLKTQWQTEIITELKNHMMNNGYSDEADGVGTWFDERH